MPFIRVKSSNPMDPQDEFDISTVQAERHASRFVVVDPNPVDVARPAKAPVAHEAPDADSAPKRTKRKTGE